MNVIKTTIIVLIFPLYLGCGAKQNTEENPINHVPKNFLSTLTPFEKFSLNKSKLAEFAIAIRRNPAFNNKNFLKIFLPADFDSSMQQKMNQAGIIKMTYYITAPDYDSGITDVKNPYEIDFTTNWVNKVPVHIVNARFENNENKLGVHTKQSNGNELWGMGDKWMIWFESSPTTSDSFPPRYNGPTVKK